MPGLDAGAFPAQQLEWLIDGAIRAVVLASAGISVLVPSPARFAVHKLILAQKRDGANAAKRRKDLAQAEALIAALRATDPHAIEDVLDDAWSRGKKGWADPIARSLKQLGVTDL